MRLVLKAILVLLAAPPWCARCGHAVACRGMSRCVECGAAVTADDDRPTNGVVYVKSSARVRAITSWSVGAAIGLGSAITGATGLAALAESSGWRAAYERRWEKPAGREFDPTVVALWPLVADTPSDVELADGVLSALPLNVVVPNDRTRRIVVSILFEELVTRERAASAGSPLGRSVERIVDRLVDGAVPRTDERALAARPVHIMGPELLSGLGNVRFMHTEPVVTLDGEPVDSLRSARGSSDDLATADSGGLWLFFTAPDGTGSRTLRVEWTCRLVDGRPPDGGGWLARTPTVLWEGRLVHEQPIEFVGPDEPAVVPTRDPRCWPWGDRIDEWRLELRSVGSRQFVRLCVTVPREPPALIAGQWSLRQGTRSVEIGERVETIVPTVDLDYWGGTSIRILTADECAGIVRWEVSELIDEPFDLARPIELHFAPDAASVTVDWRAFRWTDYVWDEPLTIELSPTRSHRRELGPGWVVWDRVGDHGERRQSGGRARP